MAVKVRSVFLVVALVLVIITGGAPARGETAGDQKSGGVPKGDCKDEKNCIVDEALGAVKGSVLRQEEGSFPDESGDEDYSISDPLYPWNVAMYHFNDTFYFWFMKPLSQGYRFVVPDDARVLVGNVYDNVTSPISVLNNLFQLKFYRAFVGVVRLAINSTLGVGGLRDCAKDCFGIRPYGEDMGRTLGYWGAGHGIYIVWPVLGSSSLRDTFGFVGDRFMNPLFYVDPAVLSIGLSAHDKVNDLSFHLGDYEALKEAAIDPYVSLRNGYVQFRKRAYHQ